MNQFYKKRLSKEYKTNYNWPKCLLLFYSSPVVGWWEKTNNFSFNIEYRVNQEKTFIPSFKNSGIFCFTLRQSCFLITSRLGNCFCAECLTVQFDWGRQHKFAAHYFFVLILIATAFNYKWCIFDTLKVNRLPSSISYPDLLQLLLTKTDDSKGQNLQLNKNGGNIYNNKNFAFFWKPTQALSNYISIAAS